MRIVVWLCVLGTLVGCSGKTGKSSDNAGEDEPVGPALRQMILTTPHQDLSFEPDSTYPEVYGVLTDMPISHGHVATAMALRDGTASLYTTSHFGVLGGQAHEPVREAAYKYVEAAQSLASSSESVTEFPYPSEDQVYFYLLTYDGVRRLAAPMEALEAKADPAAALWDRAQGLLTELRKMTE